MGGLFDDFIGGEVVDINDKSNAGIVDMGVIEAALENSLAWNDFDAILRRECEQKSAKYKKLSYEKKWWSVTDKFWSDYPGHKTGVVYVCPELTYLWPIIKKDTNVEVASDKIKQWLRDNVRPAIPNVVPDISKVIAVDTTIVPDDVWFCSTLKGVNMSPGVMTPGNDQDGHDVEKTEPLHLDDMNPHGLIAGRTGAGKSVALNAMIASLMTEFAPWELNVNLADFKIVEMSRYGDARFPAPHVSKIAATEAMEYVVSVMYDMYESMSIRQSFFAGVGVQNIKDFREKFGVVLPHVVLLVDEFQQMYELANNKQTDIINALIKMVTKLGRATGYHLLFASQSMSGTLSADVQSNFKLRVCLPAADDVSSAVLGNKASSTLRGKGYCFTNCEGGAEEANIKYRIPFLRSEVEDPKDLTELQKILKWNKELAAKVGFERPQNFFRDSAIRPMHGYGVGVRTFDEDIDAFRQGVEAAIASDKELEDILLLGDSYVYKEPKGRNNDVTLEYFKLKIGDRKNIICIGDTPYDRVYMTELLAMQYAQRGVKNENVVIQTDAVMQELIDLPGMLRENGSRVTEIMHKDFIANFIKDYTTRQVINEFAQFRVAMENKAKNTEGVVIVEEDMDRKLLELIVQFKLDEDNFIKNEDPDDITIKSIKTSEFVRRYYKCILEGNYPGDYSELSSSELEMVKKELGDGATQGDIDTRASEVLEYKNTIRTDALRILIAVFNGIKSMYVSGVKDDKFNFKNMKTLTYWVVGYNGVSSISGERNQSGKIEGLMRNCTNMGMRCIFVGGAVRDITELLKNFSYVFIKSTTENNYSRFEMNMSKEFKDNVVRFKSMGEVINNVKQHLYPIPPDEKMVKKFDTDYAEFGNDDFFANF